MDIQCPVCGAVMRVEARAPFVLCVGCGARIALADSGPDSSWQESVGGQPDSLESLVTVSAGRRMPKAAPPGRRSAGPVLAALACAIVVVGMGVAVVVVVERKSNSSATVADGSVPKDQYLRFAAMKAKAEELALQGHLAEAHAAYGRMLEDAAGSASEDSRVAALVASARADQARIYDLLTTGGTAPAKPDEEATTGAKADEEASRPPTSLPSANAQIEPQPRNPAEERAAPRMAYPAARPETARTAPAAVAAAPPAVPAPNVAAVAAAADLDGRIGLSMQRAVDLILSRFQGAELAAATPGIKSETYRAGLHALCLYALLQAGQSMSDPRLAINGKVMAAMIDAMKAHQIGPNAAMLGEPITYSHSLRAAALAVYNRPQDRRALEADVKWLIGAQRNGEYTYDDRNPRSVSALLDLPWDNSNSQYGLLGVWAGAEVGVEVPDSYWQAVDGHWKKTQQPDGQWSYSSYEMRKSLAMTCGGLASLMVTYDYLDVPKLRGAVGRDPFPGQIGQGLKWLEAADNCVQTPNDNTFYLGYDLYSLERIGLASGLKFFGTHDWYRELAEKAISLQWPSGAYGREEIDADALVGTSYVLLFLARGRHPVMMDKLRFERFWANRPRDVANLARFASRELEQPLNWQVVSVDRAWQDWFDSPVLFIASHQPPKFTDKHYENLKEFVEAGGLILTQTDGGSDTFARWVPELVSRVCPGRKLEPLPQGHVLYSAHTRITAPPKLLGAGNGSRLMVVYSPTDLSVAWQRRESALQRERFELGLNIIVYASGAHELRNRVSSPCVPEPAGEPVRKMALARLSYGGNWDPEPYAWVRLSKLLQNETGEALDPQPAAIEAAIPHNVPLAHLTGTAACTFTDGGCASLRKYVEAGGIVLIDSTGGQRGFGRSVEEGLLPRAFPDMKLAPISAEHPLMKGVILKLRPYAMDVLGNAPPIRMGKAGAGYVVYTPLDLTSGLLGTNTWGIVGYAPPTCEQFLRNLVSWSQTLAQP